jgi:hypothetical protein
MTGDERPDLAAAMAEFIVEHPHLRASEWLGIIAGRWPDSTVEERVRASEIALEVVVQRLAELEHMKSVLKGGA